MTCFNWPVIEATVFAEMPVALRRPVPTEWSRANKGDAPVDCFLEDPCWGAHGNLWLIGIPHGRILRVSSQDDRDVVAEYDGEPNDLALRHDGTLLIADYENGLLSLDPTAGAVTPFLTHRNSERFKGPNDLIIARNGDVYFTDQGQTGLHDPTGRAYHLRTDGRLDCLLANGPSPSGLVSTLDEPALFVAMTRDNAVWRLPPPAGGSTSKVGRLARFYDINSSDGMTMDAAGHLFVVHAPLGVVFVVSPHGEPLARIASRRGCTTTNVALTLDGQLLTVTESVTGTVLRARWTPPRHG